MKVIWKTITRGVTAGEDRRVQGEGGRRPAAGAPPRPWEVGGRWAGLDGDEAEELDDGVDCQRRSLGCGRSLKTNEA
jgi:hypothetical protein